MSSNRQQRSDLLVWTLTAAAALAVCGVGLAYVGTRSQQQDIAWMLYAGQRVLAGERLYRDLMEINPPTIVWLNAAVVAAASWLSIAPILMYRFMVTAVLTAAAASLLPALTRERKPGARAVIVVAMAFALFVLPGLDFGEREHLALALLMPLAAATAGSAEGARRAILAGALAGVAGSLKPHFAIVGIVLLATGRGSGRRPAAIAFGAAFLAVTFAMVPFAAGYFETVRRFGSTYWHFLHPPWWGMILLLRRLPLILTSLILSFHLRRDPIVRQVWTLCVAFLCIAFAQGKGWGYHFLPSAALAVILLSCAATESDGIKSVAAAVRRAIPSLVLAYIVVTGTLALARSIAFQLRHGPDGAQRLAEALATITRPGDHVGVLSPTQRSGYPALSATHTLSGHRFASLWFLWAFYHDSLARDNPGIPFTGYRPLSRMTPVEHWAFEAVIHDLQLRAPSALVVYEPNPVGTFGRFDVLGYYEQDARFRSWFRHYRFVGRLEGHGLYRRVTQ